MTKILTPKANYSFEINDDLDDEQDIRDSIQVVKETWVENVYQINESDFDHTGIFIDIGANIGSVSLYVASFMDNRDKNKPDIKVYAYEPEPNNLEVLHRNIGQNDKQSIIRVIPQGVWGHDLTLGITNRGGNSEVVNVDQGDNNAQFITLEKVFSSNNIVDCDMLKMDIEGAEYAVILNSDITVLRKIRYIAIEFTATDQETFGMFITMLAEVFNLHIIGRPSTGGYIYGRRY